MDPTALAAARERSADHVASLRRALDSLVEDQSLSSADDEHDPEGVTIAVQRAQLQGLLSAAEEERDELDRAAQRMAAGDYGRCAECGGVIGAERLEALPAVRTCITCASRPRRRRTAR
ncbi:TraR/DksA family transcriptional regulator [Pseudonocardia phyllosphaerae]|uniref:TraR/DksA family transcriptional regulator n=1 Tax=Pseudonocardia phyllosphaerae TaxID=3390502 RepID=UPI0039788DD2